MDPDRIFSDDAERSLLTHVRSILHNYILEHLTIDQAQYTTHVVSEFVSQSLFPVPDHEPSAVALPVDPLEHLKTTLKMDSLKPYEETFTIDGEVISYIKSQMIASKRKPKSQRIWDEANSAEDGYRYVERFSPILSRESRRKTPHIATGNRASSMSGSDSLAKFKRTQNLAEVEVEDVENDMSPDLESCLDMKFSMDSSTLSDIVAMRKDNPFLNKPVKEQNQLRGDARAFLTRDSPTKNLSHLKLLSPPLFPRRKRQRKDENAFQGVPGSMVETVAPFQLIETENMDLDVPKANMKLVEGWTTIDTSSQTPSTPSLSSGTSEVDELEDMWLPTSEADPSMPILAANAKMDVIQMPREKMKFKKTDKSVSHENNLSSFLSRFAPEIISGPSLVDCPAAQSLPLGPKSPIVESSMLGQLGSETDDRIMPPNAWGITPASEGDIKVDLDRILLSVKDRRFQDVILHEKLDDVDTLFMDVPYLPPANELVKLQSRPMSLKAWVVDCSNGDEQDRPCRLEAVSGVKSLNLELSWRPFNYGTNKPTHDEVLAAQAPFSIEEIDSLPMEDKTSLNRLLTQIDSDAHARTTGDIVLRFIREDSDVDLTEAAPREVGLLLNRAERRRQKGFTVTSTSYITEEEALIPSHQDIIEAEALAILDSGCFESPYYHSMGDRPSAELPTTALDDNSRLSFGQLMYPDDTYIEDSLSTLSSPGARSVSCKAPDDFLGFPTRVSSDNDFAIFDGLNNNVADAGEHPLNDYSFTGLDSNGHEYFPMDIPFEYGRTLPVISSISQGIGEQRDVCYPYSQNSNAANEYPATSKRTENTTTNSFAPSVALLSDRSAVRTSFFLAMRRGNATPLDSILSSPSASNRIEGQSQPTSIGNVPPTTKELPPPEVLDDPSYLWAPSSWTPPSTKWISMVSLDTVQKRALMKLLESLSCKIRTVGRSSLVTTDIIVDPNSSILFFPLSALPSKCDSLSSRVCKASWHFDRLFVIFEAFPINHCYKTVVGEHATPFAYGPPVLKALKRFRRDLSLREGLGEWNNNCAIRMAFANSVQEAAILTRSIADDCANGASKADYMLSEEELEGEGELGAMTGMNEFTANMILQYCSLNDFLEMPCENRQATFGPLIGTPRMALCNTVLETRLAQMERLQFSSDPGPFDEHAMQSVG